MSTPRNVSVDAVLRKLRPKVTRIAYTVIFTAFDALSLTPLQAGLLLYVYRHPRQRDLRSRQGFASSRLR